MMRKIDVKAISPVSTSHGCGMKRVLVKSGDVASPITQIAVTAFVEGEKAERHCHATMDEFFLIRSGRMSITVGDETEVFGADEFVSVPAGVEHEMEAVTDCEILTIGCATE
jgi:mannose-6-phosphate isomerase-like protein (cupin superfamily)